jgi:hypothetical protein
MDIHNMIKIYKTNPPLKSILKLYFYKYIPLFSIIILTVYACTKKQPEQPEETILACIGDKTISVNEFIRRAEYTIRPKYCRNDNYIHRKIALNSLIAEKLLALEAGNDNELTANVEFQAYLRGRKEQSMRQWHYNKEAVEQVNLDTSEIKNVYQFAGRTYNVSFIAIPNDQLAEAVRKEIIEKGAKFEDIIQTLTGNEDIPQRQIGWDNPEHEVIHNALFNNTLQKGQTLGPLKLERDSYVLLKVNGWTDKLAVTNKQMSERRRDVVEKLSEKKASKLYNRYVSGLMKGKKVEFKRDTFEKLVNIVGVEYYKSDQDKKIAFNKKFWNKDNQEMILDDLENQMKNILDKPLLTIEGSVWTVRDFKEAVKAHPLVFRKRRIPKNKFGEQFKLAVVDLIRDQYITKDAYKKGYDKVNVVQRNYRMWKDNLLALYQKNKYLESADSKDKDQGEIITAYLDPYIDKLQKKYNDAIEINTDDFEKIKLTNIDMFVIQRDVPFPVIVPGFPQLTTHNKLDYGKKMK